MLFRVIILLALPFSVGSTVAQDSLLRLEAPENTAPLNPNWLRWSPDVAEEVSRKSLDQPLRLPQTQPSGQTQPGGQSQPSGQSQFVSPNQSDGLAQRDNLAVERALATSMELQRYPVQPIPSHYDDDSQPGRMVRYDVPLNDHQSHEAFLARGVAGSLLEVPVKSELEQQSTLQRVRARMLSLVGLLHEEDYPTTAKVIRYEVPAEDVAFHASLSGLDSEIYEPSLMRLPEVRFFQPKARVFMDLKRENDTEFDLFSNGAVLASLDVVELYMPMPLISDRFARAMGRPGRLSQIGWRVGATLGVGITTALTNSDGGAGAAPISTLSSGIRYDFPLGRPSAEVIQTGDLRLDSRTRVGIETGIQGGISSNESLGDSTDLGWYFGILVNTPWTHY
ncbi:MAG: hypothetical protein GY904_04900 [Planctomycetaceae bacterium]|nr:hypothetical protein [Planctomycetaceae bacterium]